MKSQQEIERSLITTFSHAIWRRFAKGLREFVMIQPGDHIAVCISGGKDSMVLAKLLQEHQRHGGVPFALTFLTMDPGYRPEVRERIEQNARGMGIPLTIFPSNIFAVVEKQEGSPCFLCARMRRGHLYQKAQELGCNKIALGHHFDDAIETVLMSILYGGQMQAMMPRLKSRNWPGMELIRPMYYVREADIVAWQKYNELEFIPCACSISESADRGEGSKRQEMKRLIAHLRTINPRIDSNILLSTRNVDVDMMLGWKSGGEKHSFMERFSSSCDGM
ncbi:MAG: tRNA 2-thiocytidine biosynthesis TtcA family protein [Eubacteriales bacterium]|jgi:tRNA 2-thiocytidine biosynthesis protein TtcA